MASSFELPDEIERLKINLEDEVRTFLLRRLIWNRMPTEQRDELRLIGVDVKRLRRPSYIAVSSESDDAPPEVEKTRCNIGAEGVMTHTDEHVVHLAFKCGNPKHPYHYSTFGPETIVALAKACEAAWPGSVSSSILPRKVEEALQILDPGEDEEELDEIDLDEDVIEDEDEEPDIFF